MQFAGDAYAAAQDADALVILTDWQEFAELDLDRLHTLKFLTVVDGSNLADPEDMQERGFHYFN